MYLYKSQSNFSKGFFIGLFIGPIKSLLATLESNNKQASNKSYIHQQKNWSNFLSSPY